MDFTVRPARLDDAAAICATNRTSLGYDYPAEQTRQSLEEVLARGEDCVLVAEREGAVLGYIHGQPYRTLYHAPVAKVLALSVARDAQGGGVGRALLARLEDWARAAGFSGVWLSSGMERAGAHVFYERCGYRHVKTAARTSRDGRLPATAARLHRGADV